MLSQQDRRNLRTFIREWIEMRLKWVLLGVLVFGFLAGAAIAAEPPTVSISHTVGAGNVPTVTWSARWATGCTASNGWTGSKASSGSQTLPAITGTAIFAISCAVTTPADTQALLSWTAPTQYTDGTALLAADLAAFRVYQGASASTLARVAEVVGTARGATRTGLAAGSNYFAVTAVTVAGAESGLSEVGLKVATTGGTVSASSSTTARLPSAPVLTVQQPTAYDVRRNGLRFAQGRPVGQVPVGTTCSNDFRIPGTELYRVNREDVRLTRRTNSPVIVAHCA
jgi:hypothetical protein